MKRGFLLRCDSTIWFTLRGEKKNFWNEAQSTWKRSLSKIKSAKHTKRKKNLRLLVEIFMAVVVGGRRGLQGGCWKQRGFVCDKGEQRLIYESKLNFSRTTQLQMERNFCVEKSFSHLGSRLGGKFLCAEKKQTSSLGSHSRSKYEIMKLNKIIIQIRACQRHRVCQ